MTKVPILERYTSLRWRVLKSLLLLDRNKIRDLYDVVYMFEYCGFSGKDLLDTIIRYRITYRPGDIIKLIEAKKEDPLDYEGIINASMISTDFTTLKSALIERLKNGC